MGSIVMAPRLSAPLTDVVEVYGASFIAVPLNARVRTESTRSSVVRIVQVQGI